MFDRGCIGDVGFEQPRGAAGLSDGIRDFFAIVRVNIDDGDFAALLRKQPRGFGTYALRRAGDQRDTVLEFGITGHHDFSLFSAATAALRLIHDPQPMMAAQVQKIVATPPTAAPTTPKAGGTNTCAP